MDLNKCLKCRAMCCRLYIDVSREEYNSFEKRGIALKKGGCLIVL